MTRNKKLTIALAIVLPVVVLGSGIVAATSTPELVIPDTSSDATYTVGTVSTDADATSASPCDDCTGDCSGNGVCDGDCDGECAGNGDCDGICDGDGDCRGNGVCDGDCTSKVECGYLGCTGSGDCDSECATVAPKPTRGCAGGPCGR